MIKCVLVEDEDNSRDLLKNLIKRYCPDLLILGNAASVDEAVKLIDSIQPDLVFMDIEISGGTGFDVLNRINNKKLGIIFTTGYNEFAFKAFKYSAIDYLLKPIDFEELITSVIKFKESVNFQFDERQFALMSNNKSDEEARFLSIPSAKGFTVHAISDIVWVQSDGGYSKFKIKSDVLMTTKHIGYFEEILPLNQFYRIHNRTIINLAMIKEFIGGRNGSIVLLNGEHLEVSERRKEGLLKLLTK